MSARLRVSVLLIILTTFAVTAADLIAQNGELIYSDGISSIEFYSEQRVLRVSYPSEENGEVLLADLYLRAPLNVKVTSGVEVREDNFGYDYSVEMVSTQRYTLTRFVVISNFPVDSTRSPVDWNQPSISCPLGPPCSVGWTNKETPPGLQIGEKVNFRVFSDAIPGLAIVHVDDIVGSRVHFPDHGPDGFLRNRLRIIADSLSQQESLRYVIGPTGLPDPFVASAFADTIASYNVQAYSLGWTSDENVYAEIENYLHEGRDFLIAGDSLGAARVLSLALMKTEAENEISLSSESYALLNTTSSICLACFQILESILRRFPPP